MCGFGALRNLVRPFIALSFPVCYNLDTFRPEYFSKWQNLLQQSFENVETSSRNNSSKWVEGGIDHEESKELLAIWLALILTLTLFPTALATGDGGAGGTLPEPAEVQVIWGYDADQVEIVSGSRDDSSQ